MTNQDAKTRVLLVDDDTTLLDMYKERLEIAGFEVVTAVNGEEALAKAVESVPNVILLDIMMPKINGFDALNILKNTPETKNIPVIVLTALTQEIHRKKGLAAGADDFIVKSETMPRDVIAKIEKVILGKKAEIEKSAQ